MCGENIYMQLCGFNKNTTIIMELPVQISRHRDEKKNMLRIVRKMYDKKKPRIASLNVTIKYFNFLFLRTENCGTAAQQ